VDNDGLAFGEVAQRFAAGATPVFQSGLPRDLARLIQRHLAGIVANYVHDFVLEDAAAISVARLHLRHLSPDCLEVLANAKDMVALNLAEEPHYHIADNKRG